MSPSSSKKCPIDVDEYEPTTTSRDDTKEAHHREGAWGTLVWIRFNDDVSYAYRSHNRHSLYRTQTYSNTRVGTFPYL